MGIINVVIAVIAQNLNLYVKELNLCTDDCNKQETYKYQYGGFCLENCPDNTMPNAENQAN